MKLIVEQAFRSAVALLLAGFLARYQNDPRYLALVPVLHSAGEWLRKRYPKLSAWLPL